MDIERNIVVYLISLMFIFGRGIAVETRPAVLNSEQIRQRLSELHSSIRTWYVEYESLPSNDPLKPPGTYIHRIVAARVPDQYCGLGAKGRATYSWSDDAFHQRFTLNASSAVNEFPLDRVYWFIPLKPEDPLPGTAPQEFLFAVLGWWPFDKRPPPTHHGTPVILRDIACSPKYVVKPEQELVAGHWCHVLEYAGHDRLWLDCERNCALLARETLDSKTGDVLQRIDMKGHREVKPGIWVPMEFRNIMFDLSGQKGNRRKVADAVFKVLAIQVNDRLPDTLFRFEARPGSIEILDDGSFKQTVPGGSGYMDEMVGWVQRLGLGPAVRTGGSATSVEAVIEYIVSIVCAVAIFVLHWRKRMRGRVQCNTAIFRKTS